MAGAKTVKYSEFLVLLGDGATPTEAFSAPCGLTSRGLNRSKELSAVNVPDCDDEDAPSWVENDVVSQSWTISGSGVLDRTAIEEWDDWFQNGTTRNIRVTIVGTGANGGRTYTGAAILSTFNLAAAKADNGGRVSIEVEITGSGPLVLDEAA